jgi:hypothetical protein
MKVERTARLHAVSHYYICSIHNARMRRTCSAVGLARLVRVVRGSLCVSACTLHAPKPIQNQLSTRINKVQVDQMHVQLILEWHQVALWPPVQQGVLLLLGESGYNLDTVLAAAAD